MKHASETFEQFRDRVLKLLERLPLDAIDRTIESINDDRLIPLFRQKGPEPNIRTVLESKTLEIGFIFFFYTASRSSACQRSAQAISLSSHLKSFRKVTLASSSPIHAEEQVGGLQNVLKNYFQWR